MLKPLSYLAALKHFISTVNFIEMKDAFLEFNTSESNKTHVLPIADEMYFVNKKTLFLSEVTLSNSNEVEFSEEKDILEKTIDLDCLIHSEEILSINESEYKLTYSILDIDVETIISKTEYDHHKLVVYYMIRNLYRLTEYMGENRYRVTTPTGFVKYIHQGECDCRVFNLINRGKKPCMHILLVNSYKANKSAFLEAGVSDLEVMDQY